MVVRKGSKRPTVQNTNDVNKAFKKALTKADRLINRYQGRAEDVKGKAVADRIVEKQKMMEKRFQVGERQARSTPASYPALTGLTEGVSRKSLISTVVGVAGLVLCCLPLGVLAIISGLFAFILGLQELNPRHSSQLSLRNKGFAIAGVVAGLLSIIGALAWLMFFVYWAQSGFSVDFLR